MFPYMEEPSTRERFFPDLYLKAGRKRIDFIIVYSKQQILSTPTARDSFANFLDDLTDRGMDMEHAYHTTNPDIAFVKIHCSHEMLVEFGDAMNIDLAFKTPALPFVFSPPRSKCHRNPLHYNDEISIVYRRAKETIRRETPSRLTQAERSLVMHNILQEVRFGSNSHDVGLKRLQNRDIVLDAFPLHEGPAYLTPTGPLTDHQLLGAYWGDLKNFLKSQPIDIIHKYFGPELAFYVAFVDYCNNSLFYASIFNILFFVIGYIIDYDDAKKIENEVCNSKDYICASCHPDICILKPFKNSCSHASKSLMVDNVGTFVLGIVMSIWGHIFYEFWKRKRSIYMIKWNLTQIEYDITMRIGYEENADILIRSPLTGRFEPAMSKCSLLWRYLVTTLIMMALLIMVAIFVLLTFFIKTAVSKYSTQYIHISFIVSHRKLFVQCVGDFFQVIFILIIDFVKLPAVRYMSDLENCRTQIEYNNSFMIKLWIVGFVNGYGGLFYNAFARGIFYTYPGDYSIYDDLHSFSCDLCGAAGCNMDMIILLSFITIVRTLLLKCTTKVVFPIMKSIFRRKNQEKTSVQWENDYELEDLGELDIAFEYAEIIGRMTTVLFLSAVFPLLPLIMFLCNYLELRVDSNTYSHLKKRPVARKVDGIGIWQYLLKFVITVGVLINALASVFTNKYLHRSFYKYHHNGSLTGYLDIRFSKFAIEDYKTDKIKAQIPNLTYCLYHTGYRFPPEHERKYQHDPRRLSLYLFSIVVVVIYQHVVFVASKFISAIIPDVSAEVEEHMKLQEEKENKLLRQRLNKEYIGKSKSRIYFNQI